jgi:prevent-host-death family protein
MFMIGFVSKEAMPTIRPISDLRNKSHEIEQLCHESGEPVFITKNGEGDLVVMSLAAYERDRARLELYGLLDEAEADVQGGDRGVSPAVMRKRLGVAAQSQRRPVAKRKRRAA